MPHESTRSQRFRGRRPRSVHLAARASATAALIVAFTGVGSAQAVLHVDADLTTGANDGSSWADAYQGSAGLHAAFDAVAPDGEIWIAAGTYLPSTVGSVGTQFYLDTSNVTVRGGFEGTETSPLERRFDPGVETVLSGDLLGDDDGTPAKFADNSIRVLNVDANGATLEDVRVTAGGSEGLRFGRATFPTTAADMVMRRCTVDRSGGSGAHVGPGGLGRRIRVLDCVFRGNGGTGLHANATSYGSIAIDRCWTVDNGGDGLRVTTGDYGVPISNVVSARNGGRGIFLRFVGSEGFAALNFEHCTVVFNAGFALETHCASCAVSFSSLSHSIARGNNGGLEPFSNGGTSAFQPSAWNSLVQGVPGADADPRFRDAAGGDYRLLPDSPAIDRAPPPGGAPFAEQPFDARRQYRAYDIAGVGTVGEIADLGALEFTGTLGRHDECSAEPNSTGRAGRLFARGSDEVLANSFSLGADRLPPGQFCVLLGSRERGLVPAVGGPGTLCLAGSIGRFNAPGQILPSTAGGLFLLSIDLNQVPQPSSFVAVQPGETWRFQLWHRDVPGPSQFTGVVAVSFR